VSSSDVRSVSTACARCKTPLRCKVRDSAAGAAQSTEHRSADGGESDNDDRWAVVVRNAARREEEVEDTALPLSAPEALLQWHWANLEYANGTSLHCLSNRWWDADDEFDFGGKHYLLPDGYGGLLSKLQAGLDVRLRHSVRRVRRSARGAVVEVNHNGSMLDLEADVVICTLPLGVLKAGDIKFEPPLPQRKQKAITRLGFGTLNKVLLVFAHAFWEEAEGRRDFWGVTAGSAAQRGEAFQFFNMQRCNGHPMLLVLHAGSAARRAGSREQAQEASVRATMRALRAVFGEANVPEPIAAMASRWEQEPFSRGVYSHIAVGASPEDYDVLSEPMWDDTLLWAGEATCRRHPATVAGAFISGLREASRIACRLYKAAAATMASDSFLHPHSEQTG